MDATQMSQRELFGICPYATTQKLLSGKWALVVLHELREGGTMRFGALQRALPDLTQATLTKQLRTLEADALIVRTVYAEVPPRVEYRLSEMGEAFGPVLDSLAVWGNAYIEYMRRRA